MIADTSINDFPDIQSGRFQIIELIGTGGAGKVYKALDTTLNKTVAIKTLHSKNSNDAVRFQREAKLAAALKHPNVMQVYDFGFTQRQEPYLVLEYVEGQNLAQQLESGQPIPLPVALKTFTQIAAGLFHAHSNNVIHRDIKPGNIIIVSEGDNQLDIRALIVDFGLAKQQDNSQSLTAPGIGVGTPRYMSPEQFRSGDVDYRSDIYSFGCLMFQTLTGSAPFEADNFMQLSEQHLHVVPPSLADTVRKKKSGSVKDAGNDQQEFSEAMEKIIAKCLQKSPSDRYQSAEQLRLDLVTEYQKELARSHGVELFGEEQPEPPSLSKSQSRTDKNLRVSITLATVCAISVGLWMLGRAGFDRAMTDIPIKNRKDDDRMLDGFTKLPVSGVYLSKTGISSLYAENDQQLKENLKGLHFKRLDLSNSIFTPQGFRDAETSEATQITCISNKLDRAHLEAFAELKHLRKLLIGGMENKFNSDDLSVLNGCPELRQLGIQNQALTPHDFENFSKFTRLEELDLSDCKGVTASNLMLLKKLPNLRSLILDNTAVTDKEIHVVSSFNLKYLGLKCCDRLTEKSFEELGKMKRLTRLNIKGTSYPTEYILLFRRYNPKVIPDREPIIPTKKFDYTEFPFGE